MVIYSMRFHTGAVALQDNEPAQGVGRKAQEEEQLAGLAKRNAKEKAEDDKERAEAKAEETAADLLKSAKRWLDEANNKELARERLQDLLKRFPKSKVAPEAEKMLKGLGK